LNLKHPNQLIIIIRRIKRIIKKRICLKLLAKQNDVAINCIRFLIK
jgi:hypothetical protein